MDPSQQQHQWPQTWAAAAPTTTAAPSYHQPTSIEDIRTLWIGDLQYWVEDNYLYNCFAHSAEVPLFDCPISFDACICRALC